MDETTGVEEESSVDTDNQSYNDIPSLQNVFKVNKEPSPVTPSKKVFDVSLPDTGPNMPKSPTKHDFSELYDTNEIESSPEEVEPIISNVERPPTPPLRRSGKCRKPFDRLDPSPRLTQVGKSRMCNKKLRILKSPSKKTSMRRPPAPKIIRVPDGKVPDQYALVQFVCMTSIIEG